MSNDLSSWLSDFQELNSEIIEDSTKEKNTNKLDLFKEVLPALDRGDKFFYRKLTEEQRQEISPWILMRWLTSCSDKEMPHYLISVNDLVNNNFSVFSPRKLSGKEGHPELQWMLLAMCGTGRNINRKFVKAPKGLVKNKLEEELIKFFPNVSNDELELLIQLNSNDELYSFFRDNGYDDKTIKELLKNNAGSK